MDKASVNEKDTVTEDISPEMDELEKLEIDMQKAISDERYEDAARLRDEIKDLKHKRES